MTDIRPKTSGSLSCLLVKDAGVTLKGNESGGFVFHDIRSMVKTNMLRAGLDKAMRDVILGHSLKGMDTYYLKPTDEDLTEAMERYTVWLDKQLDGAKRASALFS